MVSTKRTRSGTPLALDENPSQLAGLVHVEMHHAAGAAGAGQLFSGAQVVEHDQLLKRYRYRAGCRNVEKSRYRRARSPPAQIIDRLDVAMVKGRIGFAGY
jgi:hypothetical protein